MFISRDVEVPTAYSDAAARLARLLDQHTLAALSETAYQAGWDLLLRFGPLGPAPGLSKLVHVRFLPANEQDGVLSIALRWEATAPQAANLINSRRRPWLLDAELRMRTVLSARRLRMTRC